MFGSLMSKQQHNINCINQILSLNIPRVTAAVRNAIRKHNIFDGDRPTNADLLYIVFECLTAYLENLNLQHIRANAQSLIKEINQIGQILEIVNVGTYLQYVDYRFRISNVISKKVSNNMVSLTLSGVYLEAEEVFLKKEKHMYSRMLDLITSVTRVANETEENSLTSDQLKFWFEDVIPTIFDINSGVHNSAIKAVETVLPFFQLSSYQEHPKWPALETQITNGYSDVVIDLREKCDSLWYKMWNLLVKLLNKKLLRGSTMINKFLSICENGFKSPNLTTRAETFLCWKVLLDIYSQDARYLSTKRIKLLLIPFKPIAKSPEIAVNKFLVWWSLICKVENQIDQYYDRILAPFLWFCFGLTERQILSRSVDVANRQEVYPELLRPSVTALINLLGPVSDVTSSFCKSRPIERIPEHSIFPSLLENVGQFLINSCGEATFLLKDIELVDAVPVCENLWTNMMNRMQENRDSALTELLLQNLTILMNASQNDEPAKKVVAHASTIALSSKNLIPTNISDEVTFGILKRITLLLTNKIVQLDYDTVKKIVANVFTFSTETQRLHVQLQQYLTLLQSQKFTSNVKIGAVLWLHVANYIEDNLTANIRTYKEVIYGYVEWVVKNLKSDQLPIFSTTWKSLARLLCSNDSDGIFWQHMNDILRSVVDETDARVYKFIATAFELIKPVDAFPTKFKSLVETVVKSTPSSSAKELHAIVDGINKLSELISGEHSAVTYQLLNELVIIVEGKLDISLGNTFSAFNKFHSNFDKFSKSQNLMKKSNKPKDSEFVFIPSKWQFRPDKLTEHQREKLKEKRVDIPALYNDLSQSQDSQSISLKPWTPKKQLHFEPPIQVDSSDVGIDGTKSIETLKSTDYPQIDEPSQSQTETMASTSPDSEKSNNNVSQSTQGKVDDEERKRKRVQHELNKLQLSIANADQYSNQGRTRRMSINLTKPEQKLRKRSMTATAKSVPIKRTRTRARASSTDNSESDVIEASQDTLPPATPTNRRGRKRNSLASKTPIIQNETSESEAEKGAEKDTKNETDDEKNVLLNVSVDSRSIGEETLNKTEEVVSNHTDHAIADAPPEANEDNSCTVQQDDNEDNVNVQDANAPVDENKSNAEIFTEKSDEVAVPEDNIDHSPIEDAHSEVMTSCAEDISASPVRKQSIEDSLEAKMSGIITSPSSNKNCSKTTELLNSTVDISPILHAKPSNADEISEAKRVQQENSKQLECNVDIDTDQIKRTELDNLIKTPLDSPMLQIQKSFNVPCSTPQSHKDTKRKFQIQGRGAQLLQLMNIRKVDDSPLHKTKTPVQFSETKPNPAESIPPNTNANGLLTYEDILVANKDLFRFSKVLPSPLASPSNGIMKRNITEVIDMDDIESPNQKRKRVSFHDPPVSATKEFIRFDEEVNPNRHRINRNNTSPLNVRNILIRKCRADSLNEIKKFDLPLDDTNPGNSESSVKSLKFNATDDEDVDVTALPLFTFSNKDEILKHVFDEYPLEDVLGKYFESGSTLNDSSAKLFASQLTNVMKNDETKRKRVLEDLSDKFPKEFLDIAFQENLTSTVIERLPPANMLNYITEKAKSDDSLKLQLMDKFSSVIADGPSSQTEMKDDFYKLLLEIISHKMSDKQLLDVLDILFEKRRTNSCS